MSGSTLSLGTTARDEELESAQPDNESKELYYQPPPYFLRQPEMTIHSLARFRLCNTDLALAAGIELPEIPTPLTTPTWTWKPHSARSFDAETIAFHLISESEKYFCLVRFEDWVQEATGSSSDVVRSLEFKHEGLSVIMYHYLRSHLKEYGKYLDLKIVFIAPIRSFDAYANVVRPCKNIRTHFCSKRSRTLANALGIVDIRSAASIHSSLQFHSEECLRGARLDFSPINSKSWQYVSKGGIIVPMLPGRKISILRQIFFANCTTWNPRDTHSSSRR
ncbi:hypothetical protein N7540_006771 [Penicillium herquei]|nr:hypothetical protein N7540_006771 [Penicillium herquei]